MYNVLSFLYLFETIMTKLKAENTFLPEDDVATLKPVVQKRKDF